MKEEFKAFEGNLHKLVELIQEDHLILFFFFIIPALLVILIEVFAHVLMKVNDTKSELKRLEIAVAKAKKEAKEEARAEFELELKKLKAGPANNSEEGEN